MTACLRMIVLEIFEEHERPNLHFCPVDLLALHELSSVRRQYLGDNRVAFVSLGTLPYFTKREQLNALCNICAAMRPGDVFLTPDPLSVEAMNGLLEREPSMRGMVEAVSRLSRRDIRANLWSSETHVEELFRRAGFVSTRISQLDLVSLSEVSGAVELRSLVSVGNVWCLWPA
ncbi:hypothetical protein COU19_00800 [Candidatus Kaiserbacteria bacterium CG10_big_fil_rev_8_21_14_0_10_56_12]|uniref:Histidine-specific methyltransferase SAM-dependent domain-containing protein n=1 Tax=Candidatus Kaiserbacteria bacterium CG10_big_fil_rev_8_21_14_0_10_56_12 TaxID=1974611 RepID=A0A2H0UAM1_9BACT|nr:MAG: hypothetical protein COU19_00800 [Candidatus Kaiserbacteria bacterium CG10_big_fil_rev_8_21_14_0_10_56_12]